jgi:hypothetical protein
MKHKLFLLLLLFLIPKQSSASSCCGGSFVFPALITGDDQAQITASASYSQISDDVLADGLWVKRTHNDVLQTLKVDGAVLLSDKWQGGVSLPLSRHVRDLGPGDVTASGLGDASLYAGYEILPEWEYSLWKPKGLVFAQVILPTGVSPFDSADPQALDVMGRGFYALGVGAVLSKEIRNWDVQLTGEGHRSFNRSAQILGGTVDLSPGFGGSLFLGGGWNTKSIRLGTGLSINYEDPIGATGTVNSSGALQRFWAGVLQGSYLIDQEWAASLTYSDETLFGEPVNVSLSQTVALMLQRRWQR